MFKVASTAAPVSEAVEHNSIIGQHSPGSTGSGEKSKKNTLLDAKRLQNVGAFLFCSMEIESLQPLQRENWLWMLLPL